VIHQVFANRSNVGDWLSARGIRSLLGPGAADAPEHLCDEPFVPQTLERLARAAPGDLVVVGGGGLLMDYFAPFWEGLLATSPAPRFCIWGAGVCDMKSEASLPARGLLDRIAAASLLTAVRDERTRRVLGRDDLPAPVGCPTLVAVRAAPGAGHGVLHVDHLGNVGESVYAEMDARAREFAARTGRPFATANNLIPAGDVRALDRVVALYAEADVVVTSRLHGCIVALATGRRVVAVSADRKVESFMRAAGLADWVLDLAEVGRLPRLLAEVDGQPDARAFVETCRRANAEVAAQVRRLAS
jgi:hypothetical protein